ncbi:MAG: serine/threonine protein kinase [Sclerophora amabilis]|nr:MAG: serine/threonine protein kinase [Sclerophora amabilis]
MASGSGSTAPSRPDEGLNGSMPPPPKARQPPSSKSDSHKIDPQLQSVRFSSRNQEIEPVHNLQSASTSTTGDPSAQGADPPPEILNLSNTLQRAALQQRRFSDFAFEPVSLPTSRVPSNEAISRPSSREPSDQGRPPKSSPSPQTVHSPPLTPAGSRSEPKSERVAGGAVSLGRVHPDPVTMTPQTSPPRHASSTSLGRNYADESSDARSSSTSRQASISGGPVSSTPTSVSTDSNVVSGQPKRHVPKFSIGSAGDSLPPSREGSPPAPSSGSSTPFTRPLNPAGDRDDPYARSKRPPQSRNLDGIDPRFIFGGKEARRGGSQSGPYGGGDQKSQDDRRHSHVSLHGGKKDHHHHTHLQEDSANLLGGSKHGGSMTELKRFFHLGHKNKRGHSPAPSIHSSRSGTRTPPHQASQQIVPFADDHGLSSRYGKFGKVLGSGAGGSVRLMKRSNDGITFAVKEFRARHSYETEKEYSKKVTAEFCIGSTLHHGNIIETLDIVHENNRWYEVMEYAPFDLFAIVMTGKMAKEEVTCSFLQIVAGVTYLHSMGLAHRDLKLDNVVVNEHGIMKLIDFGSASVFRYPFESDIVLGHGIVGSDPYLAPEVYDLPKYDPQPADIWSLAIIFCCMSLRRFPWKLPRMTDNSFKLFASPPTPGQPMGDASSRRTSHPRPKSADLTHDNGPEPGAQPQRSRRTSDESSTPSSHHRHHHHSSTSRAESDLLLTTDGAAAAAARDDSKRSEGSQQQQQQPQQQVSIRGPWRLLRLLPRESRSIIGLMLELEPRQRAKLEDVLADPWTAETPVCHQIDGGRVVKAPGHIHTLEPGTGVSAQPTKK